MKKDMRIVQVSAEFAPIAKAGGMGEVLVGLSRELSRKADVDVMIPRYAFISPHHLPQLKQEIPHFLVPEGKRQIDNTMWSAEVEDCHLHLLEERHPENYFHRERIYGYEDDADRFLYFSRAVVEYLKLKSEPIDVLHLHDWHVAAMAPLIRTVYEKELSVRAIVLSIHNVEYQGQCSQENLEKIGLKKESVQKEMKDSHSPFYNLLKGGIVYSDMLSPVSKSYGEEILHPSGGFGLDATLRKHKTKIHSVLNGIDLKLWNPAEDPALHAHYSAQDEMTKILDAKHTSRNFLAQKFGLDTKLRPWVGTVTRLVPPKGPELIEETLHQTIQRGGVFLLLGSSPLSDLQSHFEALRDKIKGNKAALLQLTYDEPLAHQIYAALDFLIVPSHSEPCGLTQLIAMHYGTIPIVRATGGLKDTVFDCDDTLTPTAKKNGFTFPSATTNSLNQALDRAFFKFRNDQNTIQKLIRHGMQEDFGWAKPAQEFLTNFQSLF